MIKKVISFLFILALGLLAYFSYPIIKSRYLNSENRTESKTDVSAENRKDTKNFGTNSDSTINNDENEKEEPAESELQVKNRVDESGTVSNITAEDCDNECKDFKDNSSDLRYCQDICGLSQPVTDNCSEKQGLDRDYCFKNEAISKADLNICDSVFDSKIKSSCKSRITEDLLEKQ